ncbi:MAG: NYN domain-containing protein [Sedimentisphaerales bacterium]|nr:NYN domain-containing protein [Sedimentisphaerales bacterium]
MNRYCFYIDGFNVYYSLNTRRFQKYKWLDYRKVAEGMITSGDNITGIYYFTTLVEWKPDAVARHKQYIKALRSVGVEAIFGRFMQKQLRCHLCGRYYKTREEKQTDVNIALRMVCDDINDLYDRAVIISGDTDLIPAIEAVHRIAPDKEIGVMFPLRRYNNSLEKVADFATTMREKMLNRCQFPDKMKVGGTTIERPDSWC